MKDFIEVNGRFTGDTIERILIRKDQIACIIGVNHSYEEVKTMLTEEG